MNINELYMTKANRDARYQELKNRASVSNLRRSSIRNQLIHPQYVEDFQGAEKQDTGFGNQVYKTHFKALYEVSCTITA